MTKFRLINIKSKFRTLLKLFPLLIFLNACEPGCVESYQFDSENTYVDSKPTADGIFGGPYSNASGGENASWHKTGLRSDGSQLILEIRGAWTAWEDIESGVDLKNLPECTMCAKKNGVDNCICKIDEVSIPEKDTFGEPLSGVDCGAGSAYQEIPSSCSCTNAHGTINDFGTYFIATNYQEKSEALKLPDDQNPCKYTEGFGLYVGLFGKNGNTMPLRAYQVYPTQKVCDITTTVEGKCIDDAGEDQIKYVYRSPNGQIFIKDDRSGNNGSDTDPGDDEYHQAGEFIKFISSDRYYHDNFGGYDVNFMGGFFRDHDSGLLEYIVGSVEDIVLGKISTIGGKREGGAIEFLYNAIVKDSSFILIVQMCLIMYVVLFGIYVLSGGIQISNKEISKRVLKIALVIFFTTETSWYFYNQLVVGLFKDSMDTIIAIFMNGSDKLIDQTSLIISSQVDRANSLSYSTRFSYVDGVIKKLLSAATSKKIWSLFFGEWFGLIYIPAIYALIFAFVFIMLTAAFVYISALLRLVFVLCLGPIFMVTVLFNKTDEIFKRWISFMASQAVQIIALFLILYLFVALIDINFNDLLSYRACTKSINFGLFNINFMVSHANRGLVDWVASFAKIGTLLFLLKMIMEKIPGFAGQLVSVGGQAADTSNAFISNTNKSAFGLAKSVMGMAGRAAGKAVTKGLPYSLSKGMDVARFTGVNKLIPPNPISFASGMYRDRQINNIINAQRKEGKAQGKSGADLNQFIRKGTYGEINKQMAESGNKLNILGVNDHSAIAKILDKQLVEDPLKKAIKDETSKMKKECKEKGTKMPLSKAELNEALRPRIADWAKKNSSIDKSKFLDLLDESKYSSLVKKHGALSSTQAAKMFAGDKDGTNQYLRHLKDLESRKQEKRDSESKLGKLFRLNAIKDKARGLQGNTAYNPKMARENFVRKKDWEERRMENRSKYGLFKRGLDFVGINPEKSGIEHINVLDQLKRKDRIKLLVTESGVMMERESDINALTEGLEGAHKATIDQIQAKYDKEIKGLDKCGKDKCGEDKSQAIEEAKKQKDNIERKLANPYEIDEAKKDIDNMVDLVLQSTLADKISELKAQKDDTEAKISLLKSTFASLLDVEKDELLRLESQASTMESIISTSQSELSEVKSRIDIHKNS
jgi:type IV secretory pathway VirB6-like protein